LKIENELFLCCFEYVIKTLNTFFFKPCFWSRCCTKLYW